MLLVLFGNLLVSHALAQDSGHEESDRLFRDGIAAYDAGRLEEAERLFSDALAIREVSDIAANLASTQLDLKKYRQAATHFQLALRMLPASAKLEHKTALYKQLALAKAHVVTVELTVNVACSVKLGQDAIVAEPGSPTIVFADPAPGQTLTATAEGYAPKQTPVTGEAGERKTITIVLERPPSPEPVIPPAEPGIPAWAPITVGAFGLAAIAVGVVGEVLRAGAKSDHDVILGRIAPGSSEGGCERPSASLVADCDALSAAASEHDDFRAMEIAGFAVGGAALAAAAIMLAFVGGSDDGGQPGTSQLRLQPLISSDEWGISLRAAF